MYQLVILFSLHGDVILLSGENASNILCQINNITLIVNKLSKEQMKLIYSFVVETLGYNFRISNTFVTYPMMY